MIVVTVEMWPKGIKEKAYKLGRMYVWNLAQLSLGNPAKGDYEFAVMRKGYEDKLQQQGPVTRRGKVKNYPRLAYNMWRLIVRCLLEAFPEEG